MSKVEKSVAAEEYERHWMDLHESDSEYYTPEKYQLGVITDFLESQGINYITEGRVFCYPIDLLAEHEGRTIAIELKAKNIGRGIEQAQRNADFADHSFLSVWESNITDQLLDEVSDLPIGLIGVDSDVQIYSTPSIKSKRLCDGERILKLICNNVRSESSVQQPQQ